MLARRAFLSQKHAFMSIDVPPSGAATPAARFSMLETVLPGRSSCTWIRSPTISVREGLWRKHTSSKSRDPAIRS